VGDRLHASDLRSGAAHYVLELRFGSRVLYFGHEALNIVRDDGTLIAVRAGLVSDVEWSAPMEFGSSDVPLQSVPLTLVDPSMDWALEYAAGRDLGFAWGQLSQWVSGTTWETRRVLVGGLIDAPEYGSKGEALAFTLKSHPFEDRAVIPDGTAVVDATTWPSASDDAMGEAYPEVFGYVGKGSIRYAGSRGLIVDTTNRYLLIAGHEVDASTVEVLNASKLPTGTWVNRSVTTATDGRGRTVSYVQLQAAGTGNDADFDEAASFIVSWGHSTNGGGRQNQDRSDAMRSAGEVLRYLLNRTTLKVDRGRTNAALDLLRGRKLDFAVHEPIGVWELIQGRLLPALPVSIRNGPEGLYPVVWRYAVDAPVELDLSVGRGEAVRVGPIRTRSTLHGSMANEFRVAYAVDVMGASKEQYLLHGDPSIASDATTATNRACRISRARAAQATPQITTAASARLLLDAVWDASTAAAAANDQAVARALPVREVTYLIHREHTEIEEGAPVAITDASLSLSAHRAIVLEVQVQADESRALTLALMEAASR